jgi:hypothetical protein
MFGGFTEFACSTWDRSASGLCEFVDSDTIGLTSSHDLETKAQFKIKPLSTSEWKNANQNVSWRHDGRRHSRDHNGVITSKSPQPINSVINVWGASNANYFSKFAAVDMLMLNDHRRKHIMPAGGFMLRNRQSGLCLALPDEESGTLTLGPCKPAIPKMRTLWHYDHMSGRLMSAHMPGTHTDIYTTGVWRSDASCVTMDYWTDERDAKPSVFKNGIGGRPCMSWSHKETDDAFKPQTLSPPPSIASPLTQWSFDTAAGGNIRWRKDNSLCLTMIPQAKGMPVVTGKRCLWDAKYSAYDSWDVVRPQRPALVEVELPMVASAYHDHPMPLSGMVRNYEHLRHMSRILGKQMKTPGILAMRVDGEDDQTLMDALPSCALTSILQRDYGSTMWPIDHSNGPFGVKDADICTMESNGDTTLSPSHPCAASRAGGGFLDFKTYAKRCLLQGHLDEVPFGTNSAWYAHSDASWLRDWLVKNAGFASWTTKCASVAETVFAQTGKAWFQEGEKKMQLGYDVVSTSPFCSLEPSKSDNTIAFVHPKNEDIKNLPYTWRDKFGQGSDFYGQHADLVPPTPLGDIWVDYYEYLHDEPEVFRGYYVPTPLVNGSGIDGNGKTYKTPGGRWPRFFDVQLPLAAADTIKCSEIGEVVGYEWMARLGLAAKFWSNPAKFNVTQMGHTELHTLAPDMTSSSTGLTSSASRLPVMAAMKTLGKGGGAAPLESPEWAPLGFWDARTSGGSDTYNSPNTPWDATATKKGRWAFTNFITVTSNDNKEKNIAGTAETWFKSLLQPGVDYAMQDPRWGVGAHESPVRPYTKVTSHAALRLSPNVVVVRLADVSPTACRRYCDVWVEPSSETVSPTTTRESISDNNLLSRALQERVQPHLADPLLNHRKSNVCLGYSTHPYTMHGNHRSDCVLYTSISKPGLKAGLSAALPVSVASASDVVNESGALASISISNSPVAHWTTPATPPFTVADSSQAIEANWSAAKTAATFMTARLMDRANWNLEHWDAAKQVVGRCSVIPPRDLTSHIIKQSGMKSYNGLFFASTDGTVAGCDRARHEWEAWFGDAPKASTSSTCVVVPPAHATCHTNESLDFLARIGPYIINLPPNASESDCAAAARHHERACAPILPAIHAPWEYHYSLPAKWGSMTRSRPADEADAWALMRAWPTDSSGPFRNIAPPGTCHIIPPADGIASCEGGAPELAGGMISVKDASTARQCEEAASAMRKRCTLRVRDRPTPACLVITQQTMKCEDDASEWLNTSVRSGGFMANLAGVESDGDLGCKRIAAKFQRICERWEYATSAADGWGSILSGDGACKVIPPSETSPMLDQCKKDMNEDLSWTGWLKPAKHHYAMQDYALPEVFASADACTQTAARYAQACTPPPPAPAAGTPPVVGSTCFVLPPDGAVCGDDLISRHGGFVVRSAGLVGGDCAKHTRHVKNVCEQRSSAVSSPVLNSWDYKYSASSEWKSWWKPITAGESVDKKARVDLKASYHKLSDVRVTAGGKGKATPDIGNEATEEEEVMLDGTDAEVAEWEQTRLWAHVAERLQIDRASSSMSRWRKLAQVSAHGDDDPCAQQLDHTADGTHGSSGYHLVGTFESRDLTHTCSIGGDCVLAPDVGMMGAAAPAAFDANVVSVAARTSSRVDFDKGMRADQPVWWKWFARSGNAPSGRYFTHAGPCPLGSLPVANPDTCESAVRQLRPIERQHDAMFVHSAYDFGGTNGLDNSNLFVPGGWQWYLGHWGADLAHTRQFNDVAFIDHNAGGRLAWDGKGRGTPHSNVQLHGRYYAQSIYSMILEMVRAPAADNTVTGDSRSRHPRYSMPGRYEVAPVACSVHNPTWDTYFVPMGPQKAYTRKNTAGTSADHSADRVDWVAFSSVCEATANDGWHKDTSLAFQQPGRSLDDMHGVWGGDTSLKEAKATGVHVHRSTWLTRALNGKMIGPRFPSNSMGPTLRGTDFDGPGSKRFVDEHERMRFVRKIPQGWEAFLLAPELLAPKEATRERCPVGNCFKRVNVSGPPKSLPQMTLHKQTYCTERTRCIVMPPNHTAATCPADSRVNALLAKQGWFDVDAYAAESVFGVPVTPDSNNIARFDPEVAHDRCEKLANTWAGKCGGGAGSGWGYKLAPVTESDWDRTILAPSTAQARGADEWSCHIVTRQPIAAGSPCAATLGPLLKVDKLGHAIYRADSLRNPTAASCAALASSLGKNCSTPAVNTLPACVVIPTVTVGAVCKKSADSWLANAAKFQVPFFGSPGTAAQCTATAAAWQSGCMGSQPAQTPWKSRHFPAAEQGWSSFVLPPAAPPIPVPVPVPAAWRGSMRDMAVAIYKGGQVNMAACQQACTDEDWCAGASYSEFTPAFQCNSRLAAGAVDEACRKGAVNARHGNGVTTMVRARKTNMCLTVDGWTRSSNEEAKRNHVTNKLLLQVADFTNKESMQMVNATLHMAPCSRSNRNQQFLWVPISKEANIGALQFAHNNSDIHQDMCLDSNWGAHLESKLDKRLHPYSRPLLRPCRDGGRDQSSPSTIRKEARSQIWRFKAAVATDSGDPFPTFGHLQTATSSSAGSNRTDGWCMSANSDGKRDKSGLPFMVHYPNTQNAKDNEESWELIQPTPAHRSCRLLTTSWMSAGGCVALPTMTHFSKDFGQGALPWSFMKGNENREQSQYFCSRPRGTPAVENLLASSPTELRYWRELLVGSDTGTGSAMVDVLESIQYGAATKDVLQTAWQKKYWDNVKRAYKMYNNRTAVFARESPDLWSHLSCAPSAIDSAVATATDRRLSLVRNSTAGLLKAGTATPNDLQAQVEEYHSNTWLNTRSSFLDKFSTPTAVFAAGFGSGPEDSTAVDPLSVFLPFRYPFGQAGDDAGVAAYNKDQQKACCEGRYASTDDTPLDRTMAFHVRTPKSVFRLGGWGSLASFIMPPALANNVICNPRSTCKQECAEVVEGNDACTSMTFGDATLTGGSGCADFVVTEPMKPHRVDVEKCHRFNAVAKAGGSICRASFRPFEAGQGAAKNLSDKMYDECSDGLDRMDRMEPWKAVSCFKYCQSYCKSNTDRAACEPGMTVAKCSESMLGGKPGLSYLRCDPNNRQSPGYWCDEFATKFCTEHKGAKQSLACACFQSRDVTTGGTANIPKCGNAACGSKIAYQTLHTKVTPCNSCNIIVAQNNCVRISDNTFEGGGSLSLGSLGGQTQNVDLKGAIGCGGHAGNEDNFVEAREAIFHELRPFRWNEPETEAYVKAMVDAGVQDGTGNMYYEASASAKGTYNVTKLQPTGWTGLCVDHIAPFPNQTLSLGTTHMGCKISMSGAEKGCGVPTPAVFDDFATNGVQAFSSADCTKRANHHGRLCSAADGVVKGSYRSAGGGTCVITPPIGAPVCVKTPHLPRTMFDAWYYTDDTKILGRQDCDAYRNKLRVDCGNGWKTTESDWQPSEETLANASCRRGMIHEIDAGDTWDRSNSVLRSIFDPKVSDDLEFRTPSEPNNKFARLCAALCENSEQCVGFEWDKRILHCAFFSHGSDVKPKEAAKPSPNNNGASTTSYSNSASSISPPSVVTQIYSSESDAWMTYSALAAAVAAIATAVFVSRRGTDTPAEHPHAETALAGMQLPPTTQ